MALSTNQQIKIGAILSYTGIAIYVLTGLLYTPWMINVIGKEDYGLYTLAHSITAFFIFDFGFSAAIQRFTAKFLAEGKIDKVNNYLSLVYRLYIFIDILIFFVLVIMFFCIPSIYTAFTAEQIERLEYVFIIVGIFSVISFPFIPLNGILSAHEKFVQLKGCDLFSKTLTVLLCVGCLYFGGGLYEIVISTALVGILVIFIKYKIVGRETNITIDIGYYNKKQMKDLLSFSGWVTVVVLCQRFIFNVAPTILGLFEGAGEIGVLGIAICLESYTFTFAFALNGLFMPKVARILSSGGEVLPLMIRVGRIQILIIGMLLVGFISIGADFINLWLGPEYDKAFLCTLLFIIPAFFLQPADIADQTLVVSGLVKYRAMVFIIMACVNVILSIVLTCYWGIIGLAISIFVAYMIRNVALYYVYYVKLHINIWQFFKESYGKMIWGIMAALCIYQIVSTMLDVPGWFGLGIKVVVVSFIYLACMLLLAMNADEKKMLRRAVNSITIRRG